MYLVGIVGTFYAPILAFSLVVALYGHTNTVLLAPKPLHPAVSEMQIHLPAQARIGLPVHLTISNINVDAALESVGLTAGGDVDVPKGPTDAAWFDKGPRPGEFGSAVIVGHYGWKDNIPAVFDDLSTLKKGDTVYVKDDKGVVLSFVVREVRTYKEDADVSEVFTSNDGKAHLNLITCGGVWNAKAKSYSNRIVVFADEESI